MQDAGSNARSGIAEPLLFALWICNPLAGRRLADSLEYLPALQQQGKERQKKETAAL
jgi:hypothetical protein